METLPCHLDRISDSRNRICAVKTAAVAQQPSYLSCSLAVLQTDPPVSPTGLTNAGSADLNSAKALLNRWIMAESPQQRSPGVLSRIGSWLSWGWGSPASTEDDPTSQTQQEEASDEDHEETGQPASSDETDSPALGESVPAETSPSLSRNAKHLTPGCGGGDGARGRKETCRKKRRSRSFERRKAPELFDQMGRRRSGRRRRSSHGDGGGAQTKSPTNPQPESPATTSLTSGPRKAWPDSAFEEAANSLPEGFRAEEANSGGPEDVVRAEYVEAHMSEDTDSPSSPESLFHATLVYSEMDEGRVLRLTESAESKRRSLKVSHSEVVFAKKVLVSSEEPNEDQNASFKDAPEAKRQRSDERARFPIDRVDGASVKSKGRIADKISLFERGASKVSSSTNLRGLDISPARHVASRPKDLTESAGTRSSSVPPNQTVKERALNFSAGRRGEEKLTLTSGHTLNEGLSKTAEISPGRFGKTTAKIDASGEPKAKSKPHLNIDQTDSKSHNVPQSTSDSSIENKEADSLPVSSPTDETPQVKSPNRTSSRSKKRRGKDPFSPTKKDIGQGKQEFVDARDVIKTTEQCSKSSSDKERPSSAEEVVSKKPRVPPKLERAAEIMQSVKDRSDSKKPPLAETKLPQEVKSKDEMERENSESLERQMLHPTVSAKSSSNDKKIERTDIDARAEEKQKNINKKRPVPERSEGEQGEGQRNRDMIVNTLFGEAGKPDPSVTKEEKPPSPEGVKEAKFKDSSERANSSAAESRKDAMWNRGSETDMLVLPEKDNKVDLKLAQRPSKAKKSLEKDCLAEITQNQKNVTETTETSKHSNEGNTTKPTEQKVEGITTKTKHSKSKDILGVRQEDTTNMSTSEGKETQTIEKHSSPEENTTSTSSATPNPPLDKVQNEPQITLAEGGGLKSDGPPSQNQSESGEEQKTLNVSSKTDLQQPSADRKKVSAKETKSKIPSTEMASIVNGDIKSGEKILGPSLEKTSNYESLSPSSVKKKPTSLSSKATEVSTEQSGQDGEKFTAKPISTDDTAFGLPASSDQNTTLSNSANEKTTPQPASHKTITTPAKPTNIEKNTSPQASTNEKTSTLPDSAKGKTTPLPASTTETISETLPDLNDDKNTSPLESTNEITTPTPVSTPSESVNKKTINEKTTLPPASPSVITTHEKPTIIEKNTSPQVSSNEKTSTLSALTKEKTTLPELATEAIPASLDSSDDKNKPPPASTIEETTTPSESANKRTTIEKTTTPQASTNETSSTSPASTKEKTSTDVKTAPPLDSTKEITTPSPASTDEKTTSPLDSTKEITTPSPASTTKTVSASLGSKDDKNKPPPASTDEKITSPLESTKEITTSPPASTNEKTTSLPATITETVSASLGPKDDKNKPPPASTDVKTAPPLDSTKEITTPSPASTDEKTTSPLDSTKEITTPSPASTTKTVSASLGPKDDKNKSPPASTDEKITSPLESTKEITTSPPASTNEKTASLPATITETVSASLGPKDDKNKPPPASTDEKITSPLESTKEITTSPPASTNEKTASLLATITETVSASLGSKDDKNKPPPASTGKKNKSPLDSTEEITTPPPASTDEKTTPLPASTTETVSALLGSSDDKNKPPPASTNEVISTEAKTTPPSDSADRKTTDQKDTFLLGSTDEKIAHSPASTIETISALPGPFNEKAMLPIASANEKSTTKPAPTTETTSTVLGSANKQTTHSASPTVESTSTSLGSGDDKTTPPSGLTNKMTNESPPASTNEKTTSSLDSASRKTENEETISPPATTNEKTKPLVPSTNEKTTSLLDTASQKTKNEETIPPPATTNEKTKPSPASTNEKTTSSLDSASQKTKNEEIIHPPATTNEKTKPSPASTNEKTTSLLDSASRKSKNEETIPPPASTNETTNETTTTPPASTKEKTTPAKSQTKENTGPPLASTSPPVSVDITSKNERTTPLPASSSFPITSSNGENITPLPSSKEKIISPQDYDRGKITPSPESLNKKPSAPEVSAKSKISPSKSTDPSTRKKEFILKPFILPEIPTAPGSSSQSRDSPSSWLDVDHQRPKKKKLLIPEPNLSSSVSETNLLNTSGEFDPDDFIANVKRLAMPFNLPQRKPNKHRLQAPSFAMPAIKEDRFEKPFDPEEFQHGLRRRREFILDLAPSGISKSQDTEVKEVDIKPKRESILTRSLIFQRARKKSDKEEVEKEKEEGSNETKTTAEPVKAKSRLERCSIVSMLRSPSKGRRMEFSSPTEGPSDGLFSPIDSSGSTAPTLSQLAPTTEPPKLIPVEETLAKNDSRGSQSDSQVILKPGKEIGPAVTPDLKTTSRDPVTPLTDTNAAFPLSGAQTSSQVVTKPMKDDGPTLVPDLKTTSLDPPVTMLTDNNAATKPSYTQSSSQNVLKPTKDIGSPVTPDLKATSGDPTVTLTDTISTSPPNGSQTISKVVPKPTKDDGPAVAPDLKATPADASVTMLTDTNAPSPSSGSQIVLKPTKDDGPATPLTDTNTLSPLSGSQTSQVVPKLTKDDGPTVASADPSVTMLTDTNAPPTPSSGSQNVLKPIKDIPAVTPDLKATSKDTTVSLLTDTTAPSPPNSSQTSSQKPTKDHEPGLTTVLKETPADPSVTMLTDTNAPPATSSGSQNALKPIKDDGPAMTPDLKTTSRDTTVTMLTDTNIPSPPNGSQTSSQVVLGPTQATLADLPVTMLTDGNAPPKPISGSQNALKPIKDDGPAMTPDLKTTSRDTTVTMLTDTNIPYPPDGSQTSSQVVLKPTNYGPTQASDLKATLTDLQLTMLTDTNAPPKPSSGSQNALKPIKDDGPAMTPDLKTTSRDTTVTVFPDTDSPPFLNGTQTGSGVVLVQPDGPTLKTTTVDPTVSKVTDASAPPPLPSFDDIKLPSLLEKLLPKEPEDAQPSKKIDPLVTRESASIPGLVDLNKAVDAAEVTIPQTPVVPAAPIPEAKPQRELPNIPAARGIHRRPAKIVIFEQHQFSGQYFEFYRDQPDATHMQLSSVISIKVVRGCWILYEKPGFDGRCIALEEEGVIELPNEWAEEGEETAPVVIGSIRLAIRDYTPPRIELFTEPAGRGRSSEYVDDTEEVGSFSRPQNTGSIKVHSGLWLVYSDPGFQGLLAVLEAGEYPFPEDWGFPSPTVGSLRTLRMGALKVEKPNAVKAVLYEKAGLQGRCVEVQGDVFSFAGTETDPSDSNNHGLNSVESLVILGGLWVGYDREGFDGQQFVLEEGEYLDWTDWGGTGEKLLSLRPVFMDFSSPHMKMFSELDFSERGGSMELVEPLENAANIRYGPQTRSIEVLAGVWVAFEDAGFSGQQYVLEKGLYGSPEDWGASHSRICSALPVNLENLENSCHFQIELFSESGFSGTSVLLQDSLPTIPGDFIVRSCRVHAGSWLAFSGECFSSHQCVLEEGFYPDLRTMGFTQPDASVLSLQPTGIELSVPSVVLFERSGLRGRRTLLKTSSVNLHLTHSCSRVSSVLALGGMWVLYEDHNFRGSQFLLKPGAIPDWPKLSSWVRIGSLRPLMQKQVHFRLRSKEAGLLMSVTGSSQEITLMRIQVSEETGGAEQIWTYQDGLLHCKCLLDVCVDVSSGVLMCGSRAVLSAEPGKPQQLWNITTDGIIRSNAKPDLVLEVKGGQQFDKHQIIVNEFHPEKLNQRWSVEIL
ncbi:hypothetical protein Q8A67_013158 [Cirrhinus molitorella]|uniref:Beta/gamma crystallin 'Greek key' domain-containing protein n=1 Tax=Cirrhinus molitorella TaxID=172907 RepID=A0AA88PSQ2_9TELE|nr:hypothetical protein Q8A67_013158 [Cirrhinus molitorella]